LAIFWTTEPKENRMQPMDERWTRAVAVAAHPDDLEYGMASAIARWTAQGKDVTYVLASRGEAGIAGLPPPQAGPLREQEQRRSAAVVGVHDLIFLDHPDGVIEYGVPLRHDIAAALRRARPEVVVTMNFELTWGEEGALNQVDHRAVGLATLDACRDAANEWVFEDAGEAWRGITGVFVAGMATATHYVDVTQTIDLGVASLREHRAYIEGLGTDFDPDNFLKNIAGFGGMAAGCEFAVLMKAFGV
jgi:LmbE family N-acetylglucosaminyl deacetylase